MTIQQAIFKAIDSGFIYEVGSALPQKMSLEMDYKGDGVYVDSVLLNPLFWQSLGKAMGWGNFEGKMDMHKNPITKEETQYFVDKLWKEEWHRFIDHLVEGKEAESFFEKL